MCDRTYRKWRPLYTQPDGNCAFNAIVLCLSGSYSPQFAVILRVCVVSELLFHRKGYYRILRDFCMSSDHDNIETEIFHEIRKCAGIETGAAM